MARAEVKAVRAVLEKLAGGQAVTYKLAETFGGEFAHVERSPEDKGKKYILTLEKAEGGKPTGKKRVFMQHDSPTFVAKWLHNMWGEAVK